MAFQFCCDQMRRAIANDEVPIVYVARLREYGVRVLDGGSSVIHLRFCPWCKHELPASLRDRWFDELERRGIDPTSSEVPAEFLDERWYTSLQSAAGATRTVKLSGSQHTYLANTRFLPAHLQATLEQFEPAPGRNFVLDLPEAVAEEFRDALTERLARLGFAADYRLTREGAMLEELIDRFFAHG